MAFWLTVVLSLSFSVPLAATSFLAHPVLPFSFSSFVLSTFFVLFTEGEQTFING